MIFTAAIQNPTTPEYLEQAMITGHRTADGVMIYRHQDPQQNAEKYQIIQRLFRRVCH